MDELLDDKRRWMNRGGTWMCMYEWRIDVHVCTCTSTCICMDQQIHVHVHVYVYIADQYCVG